MAKTGAEAKTEHQEWLEWVQINYPYQYQHRSDTAKQVLEWYASSMKRREWLEEHIGRHEERWVYAYKLCFKEERDLLLFKMWFE